MIHDARNQLALASSLAGGWAATLFNLQAKALPIDVPTGLEIGGDMGDVLTIQLDTAVTDALSSVGFSLVSTATPNGALTDFVNRRTHWSSFDPVFGGIGTPAAGTQWVLKLPPQLAWSYLQLIAFSTVALTTGSVSAFWSPSGQRRLSYPDAVN